VKDKYYQIHGQVRTHGELIRHDIQVHKHRDQLRKARNLEKGAHTAITRHANVASKAFGRYEEKMGFTASPARVSVHQNKKVGEYQRAHEIEKRNRHRSQVAARKAAALAKLQPRTRSIGKQKLDNKLHSMAANILEGTTGTRIVSKKAARPKKAGPEKVMVLNGVAYRLIRVTSNAGPTTKRIAAAGKVPHVTAVGTGRSKKVAVYASTKSAKSLGRTP